MGLIFVELKNYIILLYQHLRSNKWSIFQLTVFAIIFYFLYNLTRIQESIKDIKDNWAVYKTNPLFLPISGFFMEGNVIKNTYKNFQDFIFMNSKNAFYILIRPIQYIFTIITRALSEIVQSINNLRKMSRVIRELFQQLIGNVFEQLTRSVSTLQFYNEKFRNLMKKQYAVFQIIYYYLETLRATFSSMFNGPLPVMLLFLSMFGALSIFIISMCLLCPIPFVGLFTCPICAACFDGDTLIDTDTDPIKIKDVRLGDNVYPNQTVLGFFEFEQQTPWTTYKLGGAHVTDTHIFYNDDGFPQRVADIANQLEKKDVSKVYCISTSTNLLYSGGQQFSDYYEIASEKLDQAWNDAVMKSLNGPHHEEPVQGYTSYPTGFLMETVSKPDNTTGFSTHLIHENGIELFDYNGIICSGNNIVFENEMWKRVRNCPTAKPFEVAHTNRVVHWTTVTGTMEIQGFTFRDCMDTSSQEVYDWWDKASIETINMHIC